MLQSSGAQAAAFLDRHEVDEVPAPQRIAHQVPPRRHRHHRGLGRDLRRPCFLDQPAPGHMAGEPRRRRLEPRRAQPRAHPVRRHHELGFGLSAIREAKPRGAGALRHADHPRPEMNRGTGPLRACGENPRQVRPVELPIGVPETCRAGGAERHARHQPASAAVAELDRRRGAGRGRRRPAEPERLQDRDAVRRDSIPAPTSASAEACSKSSTRAPRRASAVAAARPPIPAPTTAIRRPASPNSARPLPGRRRARGLYRPARGACHIVSAGSPRRRARSRLISRRFRWLTR